MTSEPQPSSFSNDLIEEAAGRVKEAVALLELIESGDLLCELPADRDAREAHQRAVSVLAVLKRDLLDLERRLGAGWTAAMAAARVSSARHDRGFSP
jgi:hypothetical protein